MIYVYNIHKEDHSAHPNNFYIGRGSPVGNIFTHIKGTGTFYDTIVVESREEAIRMYKEKQFPHAYETSKSFKEYIDTMYEKYKNGEDIYLACFCKPLPCHGDVIKEYLEKRLIKENLLSMNKKR